MATKHPHSYQYRARTGTARRYLLSGIPPVLWDRARKKARVQHLSIRQVILTMIDAWAADPETTTAAAVKEAVADLAAAIERDGLRRVAERLQHAPAE